MFMFIIHPVLCEPSEVGSIQKSSIYIIFYLYLFINIRQLTICTVPSHAPRCPPWSIANGPPMVPLAPFYSYLVSPTCHLHPHPPGGASLHRLGSQHSRTKRHAYIIRWTQGVCPWQPGGLIEAATKVREGCGGRWWSIEKASNAF